MNETLSHRCSRKVDHQAGVRSTAKLKTPFAIFFAIIIALLLVPRLTSGELLTSASVQTAAASPQDSRAAQNVPNAAKDGYGVEILSDTRGVNFKPYVQKILPIIKD